METYNEENSILTQLENEASVLDDGSHVIYQSQSISLNSSSRYLQIAFNHDISEVSRILPRIPKDPRILIEAGTPFIKREGIRGIQYIRRLWKGFIVADLKVSDGAEKEVNFSYQAGANAATVLGSAPTETIDLFNKKCEEHGIISMVDFLAVDDPLKKLLPLKYKPKAVIIHKGRDEESSRKSIIRYKDISKIRSKYDVLISVASGLTADRVRVAYFNGAMIAILNIVYPDENFDGISTDSDIHGVVVNALREIGQ